jgi:hypothetical protein
VTYRTITPPSWLTRLLAPLVLLLGLAAPAHAVVYVGIWDPEYGQPFAGLGWRGTAQFFVPDTCVPTGSADVDNASACGGAAAVTAASVELYDVANPTPTLATLVFTPSTLLIDTLRYINGELTQLDTTLSDFVLPNADLSAFGVGNDTSFALQFTLENPRLAFASECRGPNCDPSGFNDNANFPPDFRITRLQVPEPGTLALVALAIVGAAAARRRTRRG